MTKPTEGPYKINKYGSIGAGPFGTTPIIATVEPFYGADKVHGDHQANARLLAKSWEMREALAALVARFDVFTSDDRHGWGNQENAYYDLAKNAQKEWAAAKALLASIGGDSQ